MSYSWTPFMHHLENVVVESALHYTLRAPVFGHPHRHEQIHHLSYVVSGRAEVFLGEKGFFVGPGDALLFRPGQVHASRGDEDAYFELIEVKWRIAPAESAAAAIPALPALIHVRNRADVVAVLDRLVAARLLAQPADEWLLRLYLAEALILLSRQLDLRRRAPAPLSDLEGRIRIAAQHIVGHYAAPIAVADLADLVGLSPSHFAAAFQRIMKVSPIEFLISTRLRQAGDLLRGTTLPVAQVAAACGFHSPQYFARLFRQREGVTPTEYRRQPPPTRG